MEEIAPLVRAWTRAIQGQRPFTIPGHKRRAAALWPVLGDLLDSDVPLYGGLDTVKQSAGSLADAEGRAAMLWGGDWARFSSGGSTHGNQAMALAVGRPGDTVLVARNAHRSTLLGLVFAGLDPVWLPVGTDPRFGIPTGVEPASLGAAIAAHPDATAVLLTEPAYLGVMSDLPALVDRAHDGGLPVIVDQAWGAHLGFQRAYPSHALAAGADAMVTSAHKTLLGYSQACLVVARLDRLERGRLDRAFDAAHTTSPAGSILASIDASRALLETVGPELMGDLADTVAIARARLRSMPGVTVPGPEDFPPGRFDPAKLVVQLAAAGADGIAVERAMIAAGHPVEMADRDTLVPIVTAADDRAGVLAMVDALAGALDGARTGQPRPVADHGWPVAAHRHTPRAAFFAERETVPWQRAAGRVCAEVVAPYPPGVPVLVPGELIAAETLHRLRDLAAQGTRVAYAADPSLDTMQVLRGDDR
jgi:lysine decarboxylase